MKKIFALIVAIVLTFSCTVTASAAESKYKGRTDFMWGVTSHDSAYMTYRQDPEYYIKATAETGAKIYRIGFNAPLDGVGLEYLDKQVKLCDEYGLEIQVLLRFVTYELDEIDLNTQYFEMVAQRYNGKNGHGFIDYIEVGAEEDVRMLNNKWPQNGPNGDSVSHYYESDLVKWQKLYASCIKGVRSESPDTKIVIDFSHLHYAPLLYMHERGLDFDILGLDWYTNMGPLNLVLDPVLAKFPHDIMITETNLWTTANDNQEDLNYYNRLFEFMDIAYATPRVKSLIIYELMDEPEFENWGDTFMTQEAHFGLCEANKDGTIKRYKPIYHKVKELWGGGPVKKVPVTYEQPVKEEEEPYVPMTSNPVTSTPNKDTTPNTNNNNDAVVTPDENVSSSVQVIEPQKNVEIKQLVTTNTIKRFPLVPFIIGTVVILLLGAFCMVFFVIKPPFTKVLFKKKS